MPGSDELDLAASSEDSSSYADLSMAVPALEESKKLSNPLGGLEPDELVVRATEYCELHGITEEEDIRAFQIGAQLAGNIEEWNAIHGISEEEKAVLQEEVEHKWKNPRMLYLIVAICSLCATVQGMDETVVNGAQAFYKHQFGIGGDSARDTWLLGLVNGAPYLCCAVFGCWLTHPMNQRLGRRGTIFVCEIVSIIACIWQAVTNNWWHLFIARCALGFGLGPKSATTPMFAAECAPPRLRGALVMQWQMWTAFGIMLGYAADLALYEVPDVGNIVGLRWRLMLASAALPAILCAGLVWTIPESPRWYLNKEKPIQAYQSMCRLRFIKIQAARDIFYADALLNAEKSVSRKAGMKELLTVRRNRNAFVASEIVMFMQQFCGINVVAYYSTEIFLAANFKERAALFASFGFGVINFVFALPAFWTIDTFGRRNLLLATFPGPVPFTYSAEAYPLYIRPIGMSCATATTWFFNFLLAVTWPSLQSTFTSTGAFSWYAGWNIIGFVLVLLFLPETKGHTLEELDAVFDVPVSSLIRYGKEEFIWFWKSKIFRQDVPKPVPPHSSALGDRITPLVVVPAVSEA
ncbi:unnamed protein product [Parascedosporium putredinis]|uniref:Major facilitator superfamily (MFS) profile domain-containing protein n=1 Tax=Parascedosporium putredinis TaxID=1442378 RepID=A0A9P1H791_9PEZI|nr:unnamed protein product [Parascedosporium putredinis]CAI7999625.1 unnamed protein product [Parascedosporium putredinis]